MLGYHKVSCMAVFSPVCHTPTLTYYACTTIVHFQLTEQPLICLMSQISSFCVSVIATVICVYTISHQ